MHTVPPTEVDPLSRPSRVAALDAVLAEVAGPVLIVAHSAGVMTTVPEVNSTQLDAQEVGGRVVHPTSGPVRAVHGRRHRSRARRR